MAEPPKVVIDTNVVVAGFRSSRGASFRLVAEIGRGRFDIALSVPLVLEYEEALHRHLRATDLTREDVDFILDYYCSVGKLQEIFYLWRPILPDPKDDLVLEVAVAGQCDAIITYNRRDFEGAKGFGLNILEPVVFLKKIEVIS